MSAWVDLAVYAVFIVSVWGWLPAWSSRLTTAVIADRNPDWVADHPGGGQRIVASRWCRRAGPLWGAFSLLALIALQAAVWPQQPGFLQTTSKWEALKNLNSALLIVGAIYVAGRAALFYRWLHARVPLSARRRATLERRSLHDYVSRPHQYVVYATIALHLAAWAIVGAAGGHQTPAFWPAFVFQIAISVVLLLVVIGAVRRRPGTIDRIFGPAYRRAEVRIAFAAQLLPLFNGVARLFELVAGSPLQQVDRFLHLGLVLFLAALVMALGLRFRRRADPGAARWRRSAAVQIAGAGLLAFVAMSRASA
jgi:hypothetical protein